MDYCDHNVVVICGYDPDATETVWASLGTPSAFLETPPADQPVFVMQALDVSGLYGCETDKTTVEDICGTTSASETGRFFCAFDINPECDTGSEGEFTVGLAVTDYFNHTTDPITFSLFSTVTWMNLTVTTDQ